MNSTLRTALSRLPLLNWEEFFLHVGRPTNNPYVRHFVKSVQESSLEDGIVICLDDFGTTKASKQLCEAILLGCLELRLKVVEVLDSEMLSFKGQAIGNHRRNKVVLKFEDYQPSRVSVPEFKV